MSIKQKIWDKMEKDGYITDQELCNIYGFEPNFYTAKIYENQWKRLQHDKEYFSDKKIIEKKHACKRYLVRYKDQEENQWITVGKDFYLSLL